MASGFFNTFKKTLGLEEEVVEEVQLQPDNSEMQNAEPQDVLPVNLSPEQTEEARLKDWARQKVLQEWRAKVSKSSSF